MGTWCPPEEATHGSRLAPRGPVGRLVYTPSRADRRGTAMPTKAPADSAQQKRKSAVIDDITNRLKTADASVLTEYRGLTVTDLADLRAALRPAETDYKIYKNTLARRAAAGRRLRRDGRRSSRARSRSPSFAPRATRSPRPRR